jgi:acyl dehydratase
VTNVTEPTVGETHTLERTFTVEEVQQFGDLSGDDQPRHTVPDEEGRVMVQGLLTATMPTSIGGDLEFLAHAMNFQFRRPVFTGEQITCELTNDAVSERADRYDLVVDVVCENEAGETVLTGTAEGHIPKDA